MTDEHNSWWSKLSNSLYPDPHFGAGIGCASDIGPRRCPLADDVFRQAARLLGFVIRIRRIRRVQTPLGFRVEQITNAYRVHELTSGLGLFVKCRKRHSHFVTVRLHTCAIRPSLE